MKRDRPLERLAGRIDMKPLFRAGRSEKYIRDMVQACLKGEIRAVGTQELTCQGIASLIISQIHFPKNVFDMLVFFVEEPRNYGPIAVNGYASYIGSLKILTNKDAQKFRALYNEEYKEFLKKEIENKQNELDSL